jgi:hypothetical protein
MVINSCKINEFENGGIEIDLSGATKKIAVLDKYKGKRGWLQVSLLSLSSFELEEYLIISCVTEEGEIIPGEIASKLFNLPQITSEYIKVPAEFTEQLQVQLLSEKQEVLGEAQERNSEYYNEEIDKLDKWADDMKLSLEKEVKDLELEIKLRKAESRKIIDLKLKVKLQREIKDLEKKRNEKRKNLFEAQDQIDERKEKLLNDIESRLEQDINIKKLFTINWNLI